MNIFATDLKARRVRQKVTLLESESWSGEEVKGLILGLKAQSMQHPRYPRIVVLYGEFTEPVIRAAVPGKQISISVIEGLDNPALPFQLSGW